MDPVNKKAINVIEAGLGSTGRMKILKILSSNRGKPLTRYAIAKETGLRYGDLVKNLRILVEIGWVEELSIRPVKYKINLDNKIVNLLVEFFYKVNYI